MGKSRVLIVGATGGLGKHIVKASAKLGNPTFILVRSSSAPDAAKKELLAEFESLGVISLYGDLNDHASLVAALKQVDVVISTVGSAAIVDGQLKLIEAIKEVGHIKRFLPSEFGCDCERYPPNEKSPLDLPFAPKRVIRKAIREAGIPHTFVLNGAFAGFLLAPLGQIDIILSGNVKPPREKITILGSGEAKIVTTVEDDIGTIAVKAADDPRALNKLLVIRPKPNMLSFNSVVELWEKKLGHSLHKTFVPEAEVHKQIDGLSQPARFLQALLLEVLSGKEIYPLSPSNVAADELYPDFKYITVDEYLDNFVEK